MNDGIIRTDVPLRFPFMEAAKLEVLYFSKSFGSLESLLRSFSNFASS
jgi:hypothetical protein